MYNSRHNLSYDVIIQTSRSKITWPVANNDCHVFKVQKFCFYWYECKEPPLILDCIRPWNICSFCSWKIFNQIVWIMIVLISHEMYKSVHLKMTLSIFSKTFQLLRNWTRATCYSIMRVRSTDALFRYDLANSLILGRF